MTAVFILAVIFGGIVLSLAVIGGTILMIVKLRQGGFSRRHRQSQMEEAQMIQDIYRGLSKMEARLDALETILMDRPGKEPKE